MDGLNLAWGLVSVSAPKVSAENCQSSEATNFLGLWLYVVGLDWRLEDVTVTPLLLGLNGNLLAYLLTSKRAGVLVVVSSSDPVVSLLS